MASSGKKSWIKYYNGNDGITVKVKKSAPYYENQTTSKSSGQLSIGTQVIYRDSFSQHIMGGGNNKIAFQFNPSDTIYYSSIDNFKKPGETSGIGLKPKNFGLENKTFSTINQYYNAVISGLDKLLKSKEIGGELYEYLMATINCAKTGTGDFTDIEKKSLPWGEISSYFAEVAGPLACVSGHCSGISQIISSPSSCRIYIPNDSVNLYDYKLISGDGNEHMISAKTSKGASNVVKPQFVIDTLNQNQNDTKLETLKRTLAYKVLQVLAFNDVKSGPFYAYQLINPSLMNDTMISSIMSVYRRNEDGDKLVPNYQFVKNFVDKLKSSQSILASRNEKNTNVGLIRYVCEQEITKWSKTSAVNSHLKQIFQKYINYTRVIYVKMSASASQNPSFTAFGGGSGSVKKVNSVFLRSKNTTSTRANDKIGFQVQ